MSAATDQDMLDTNVRDADAGSCNAHVPELHDPAEPMDPINDVEGLAPNLEMSPTLLHSIDLTNDVAEPVTATHCASAVDDANRSYYPALPMINIWKNPDCKSGLIGTDYR